MIQGSVSNNYVPLVTLTVEGPNGASRTVQALFDTGYNGQLMLSPELVEELELPEFGDGELIVASDQVAKFNTHRGTVYWDGEPTPVTVDALGSTSIAGMLLLRGYDLHVEGKVGGRVVIEPSLD